MLANLRNRTGLFHTTLASWFRRDRSKRECKAAGAYVEINPFLCAMSDLLPEPGRALNIAMIVREPAAWAQSMTVFKASRKYRHVIDFVPFAKPSPFPRPADWSAMPEFERNLARWVWVNERILDLQKAADRFSIVRFENLFGPGKEARKGALAALFDGLDLRIPTNVDWSMFERRANPGPSSNIQFDQTATIRIAGKLGKALGYDL